MKHRAHAYAKYHDIDTKAPARFRERLGGGDCVAIGLRTSGQHPPPTKAVGRCEAHHQLAKAAAVVGGVVLSQARSDSVTPNLAKCGVAKKCI